MSLRKRLKDIWDDGAGFGTRLTIEWKDAWHDSAWRAPNELPDSLSRVVSTGFLVKLDDEQVVIAMSMAADELDTNQDVAGTGGIPLAWLVSVEETIETA